MGWWQRVRICEAGRPVNEDGCGITGNFAWIADGAGTAGEPRFAGSGTDAAWLVDTISRTMSDSLEADSGRGLDELLDVVERDLRTAWGARSETDPAGGPTCCLGLIEHWRYDGRVNFALVGDVVLLVTTENGQFHKITDERVKPFEARSLAALGPSHRPDGIMPAAARAQIQANRALMNTPDGFPIVCPAVPWVKGLLRGAGRLALDKPVVMMTDGFYRLVDVFGRYTDATLYEACAKGRGPALLQELRALEAADADMTRYPRFKVHDDASVLVVQPKGP